MKSIDDSVIDSVVETLKNNRLFRYDCEKPEESPTARLEKRFAEIIGVKYCVAMNSCSSALFTSLVATGVKPGDKVLIPAFTFIAVPSAIVHAGGKPILVEVTDEYVIDPYDLEKKITPDTKHLLLSYMRGRVPDLDAIREICTKHDITIIEDSAHSLGVQWDGELTGRFGKTAAFSAQSYKMIDGGEGGLLVTNDKEVAFKAMLYAGCYERNWAKHFGIDDDAEYVDSMVNQLPAYNFRMSNLSAAALLPQIEQLDARVERYNSNYERLVKILAHSDYIRVPGFHPKTRPAADSIQFYLRDLSLEQIKEFQDKVSEQGVKLSIFGLAGKNARCFWHWTFFEKQDCPKTRELLKRTADMRLRLHLEEADIDHMGKVIVDTLEAVANG
jgi:dTDP-4-amino-4,6-dideoxygalactose transaminase